MTERMLNALGVTTCGDLYKERAILHLLFSQVSMQSFLCICLGIGSVEVYRYMYITTVNLEIFMLINFCMTNFRRNDPLPC